MIGIYRQQFKDKSFLSKSENKDKVTDNNVGEKPFRCLLEEMLHCGATNEEMCSEFSTFMMAVRLYFKYLRSHVSNYCFLKVPNTGQGHETIVTTLQFALVHLASNRSQLKKCQEEVDSLMESKRSNLRGDERIFLDASLDLNMDDLSSLEHLKRCIMETMRITPAIPIFARRLDAPLNVNENLTLPANSTVVISPWLSHRDPEYFPEPETFDPDRHLPENIKQRHPFAYIPFSGGSRNCIGYKLAMIEMKVILTWLLYHFDLYTTDKFEDVKLLFQVTLVPERNYNVALKRRR